MQLVMVTQYFDTIKSIGEMDKTNTLFLSHSPGAVRDISEQIMQSMLIAERAKALSRNLHLSGDRSPSQPQRVGDDAY